MNDKKSPRDNIV